MANITCKLRYASFVLQMLGFGALSAISSIAVAQERAEVRVGVFHSISDAGIYVAKEKGYFAEENIDISLYKVGSAANVVTQLGGMCPRCEGMGVINDIDLGELYDPSKSLSEGAIKVPGYTSDGWATPKRNTRELPNSRTFASTAAKPFRKMRCRDLQFWPKANRCCCWKD